MLSGAHSYGKADSPGRQVCGSLRPQSAVAGGSGLKPPSTFACPSWPRTLKGPSQEGLRGSQVGLASRKGPGLSLTSQEISQTKGSPHCLRAPATAMPAALSPCTHRSSMFCPSRQNRIKPLS
jgi:hypothetical protein